MASPKINYEKAAKVLVSVVELGTEQKAAAFHGVAERTVRNYKRRLDTDPELAAQFRRLSTLATVRIERERLQAEVGWRRECHSTLRAMLETEREVCERLRVLVKDSQDIGLLAEVAERVARSADRIGQLDVATEALGVGNDHHRQNPPPAEDEGGSDKDNVTQ